MAHDKGPKGRNKRKRRNNNYKNTSNKQSYINQNTNLVRRKNVTEFLE